MLEAIFKALGGALGQRRPARAKGVAHGGEDRRPHRAGARRRSRARRTRRRSSRTGSSSSPGSSALAARATRSSSATASSSRPSRSSTTCAAILEEAGIGPRPAGEDHRLPARFRRFRGDERGLRARASATRVPPGAIDRRGRGASVRRARSRSRRSPLRPTPRARTAMTSGGVDMSQCVPRRHRHAREHGFRRVRVAARRAPALPGRRRLRSRAR